MVLKKMEYITHTDEAYVLPDPVRKLHIVAQEREDGQYRAVQVMTQMKDVGGGYRDEAKFPLEGILKLPVDVETMQVVGEAFIDFAKKLGKVKLKV